ncbi:hypothetical protein GF407_04795 [candidate division KSB1 bacterium]|nr:hypothetical protein [candidate division KSB1 bacterium]
MKKSKPIIPDDFRIYFRDCDPGTLDLNIHKRFIAERILVYGDRRALRWLRRYLSPNDWKRILVSGKNLDAKTRNYWLRRFERTDQT